MPHIEVEQRAKGWEASLTVRRARAEIKRQLRAGEIAFSEAFRQEDAQGMKVVQLLTAVKGVGAKKAQVILDRAGISPQKTVRGLGPKQQQLLLAEVAKLV